MTVIRGKQIYNYPKPNSHATSDTESLHLESDAESLNEEPFGLNLPHGFRSPFIVSRLEDLANIKKSSGKKKMRRYQNKSILHTLIEDDESEDMFVVMETYKSPFARLLEDPSALKYWNSFIEKSEEEQCKIVRAFSDKFCEDKKCSAEEYSKSNKHGKISSRIKRTIKVKKNLSLEEVKALEDDLIKFFEATPNGTYIKYPPRSFDRLLLYALAQYHRLKALSVFVEEIGKHSVEVYNMLTDWAPADPHLTEFVTYLRR